MTTIRQAEHDLSLPHGQNIKHFLNKTLESENAQYQFISISVVCK